MASQPVKGFGSTRRATDAATARNTFQNTENLYNQELVDWAFEDLSIPASKIIGGVTPAAHAPSHSNNGSDEVTVENLGTVSTDTALALKPDGSGGLVFGSVVAAISYDQTYALSLVSTLASVSSTQAMAIGYNASAGNNSCIAIGSYANATTTSPQAALAIGNIAVANSSSGIAIGHYAKAYGDDAIAIGVNCYASYTKSLSIGNSVLSGINAIAIGHDSRATGNYSVSIGRGAVSNELRENVIGEGIAGGGASTFRLGISSTNHFTFSSWTVGAGLLAVTHSLPVEINGVAYNLLLNQ